MNRLESKMVIDDSGTRPGPVNCRTSESIKMGRGVQTFDRAMVRCVDQVRLDCNLLPSTVSGFAAPMSPIEVLKDGVPCLGVAFLICKTANGPGNHAVNYRLVIVGIGPPRTCAIPVHSRRIVRPSDSAGNDAAGNS